MPEAIGSTGQESQCGATLDFQHVEQYDGSFNVTTGFVENRQRPVAQTQWRNDLAARYDNPGDVNGQRWCSGTLISEDLYLTAAHCFREGNGWTFPRDAAGNPIAPAVAAQEMLVRFNYQRAPDNSLRTEQTYTVDALVEFELNGLDVALLRLNGAPGLIHGAARIARNDAATNEPLAIIGHPAGQPKQLSTGNSAGISGNRLNYGNLDTLGGNSGSGILHSETGLLVGVHTNGGCTTTGGNNFGMRIGAVLAASTEITSVLNAQDRVLATFQSQLGREPAESEYVQYVRALSVALAGGSQAELDRVVRGTADVQLVGDFMDLGHDQVLHINRGGSATKIMILDRQSGTAPGTPLYWEEWGQSGLLNGWVDGEDLQLAGDFMNLGYDQVMFINRDGVGGKVMVVDYKAGIVPGTVRAHESWTGPSWLGGWIDDGDLQRVGDFRGLGHDQVMFINRGGIGGKVMVLDYSVSVQPGLLGTQVYSEAWGQSAQLDGWIGDEDLQLVGDFTNLGYDQVMFINRDGTGGKVMVVDYGSGAVPGTVRAHESWTSPSWLGGWIDDGDLQRVGDFRGLGHDQVMFINRGGTGGKVMVLDYAVSVQPGLLGTQVYSEAWGQSNLLLDWLDPNDLLLTGDFRGLNHAQAMFINRAGTGGTAMVVDYVSGTAPGTTVYYEDWASPSWLGGWID
ncbi:serine protease [Archangium sp. Cb G35]|uniref:trypsin-like serine peptidase n=1 Tax=Archangium sp. Cb G35 TaxID=1920190 RepID=UPI001E4BB31B|nr:serine protease [Archangium sp. Cb G35]